MSDKIEWRVAMWIYRALVKLHHVAVRIRLAVPPTLDHRCPYCGGPARYFFERAMVVCVESGDRMNIFDLFSVGFNREDLVA